jgi:hypothetical protein
MPVISIDKLSFTARLDDRSNKRMENTYIQNQDGSFKIIEKQVGQNLSTMTEYLNNVPYECEYRHMTWNLFYQHQFHFKESTLFIQIGEYEGEQLFRMEFNPNKLNKEYLTFYFNIIKRIKYPNVTRIDWAIDYEKDFSKLEFRQLTVRKTIEYKSRAGVLETLYLGSLKSDMFIRIYNKALERKKAKMRMIDEDEDIKVKETLWRVEAVVKDFKITVQGEELPQIVEHPEGRMKVEVPRLWHITGKNEEGKQIVKEYELKPEIREVEGLVRVFRKDEKTYDDIFKNPFKNLEVYEKYEGSTKELKTSEKAMLFYLQYNPEAWDELSTNTRKKYEELNYTYNWMQIKDQPSQVFEQEKNRLADELESWLKPALDKSNYLTGYQSNVYHSLKFIKEQAKKEGKM